MNRPGIIVLSTDDSSEFTWMSDGWHSHNNRHTPEAKRLMVLAKKTIEAGVNVPDTIRLLIEAGFDVRRAG